MKVLSRLGAVCALIISIVSGTALASTIGSTSDFPGYSARDILLYNFAASDGIYWIDPDYPGGNAPFMVFSDMTASGGGWTLALDTLGRPDMSSQSSAIQILS
jgi:hypothetical protein